MSAGSVELRLVGIQLPFMVAKAREKIESVNLDLLMFQKNLSSSSSQLLPSLLLGASSLQRERFSQRHPKEYPRSLGSLSGCSGFVLSMLQILSFRCLHRKW